ncbi:hypothetical protein CFC21_023061 [Triticum aestivum]|uniref:Uncharacterized protein n=2 Tax=Triticum aestivum TaxID=4565 RepID=A0A9R1J8I9_WHEAT|nr:hypothetical protein CFC21_023061 [Triticum aestivum]
MEQRAAGGVLRRSLRLGLPRTVRALSTSATTPAAAAEGEAAANARRNKKKNLFDVAQFLPDWGVGYRPPRPPGATSPTRSPRSTSTRYVLMQDGRHGKAWGIRHKDGVQAAGIPIRISRVNKRGWKYIKAPLEDIPGAEPPSVTAA